MIIEQLDRRVLGAVRMIDNVTGLPISSPVKLMPLGFSDDEVGSNLNGHLANDLVQFVRNRNGDYVIFSAKNLEFHTNIFEAPPNEPEIGSLSFTIQVQEPGGNYLSRQFSLRLPRNPSLEPTNGELDLPINSLFRPAEVTLYRSPNAEISPNWSILRGTIIERENGDHFRLPWALVRVSREETPKINILSMADWRGEVLVSVPGVPVTISNTQNDDDGADPDNNSVSIREVGIELQVEFNDNLQRIEVTFDPDLRRIVSDSELIASTNPNDGHHPNPDETNYRIVDTQTYPLIAGRERAEIIVLPP